jgi:hypothetical protein
VAEPRRMARKMARRFAVGSGPLKRKSDRIQMVGRVLLVVVLLATLPISVIVAGAVSRHTKAVAAAESAARHRVTATLVENAPPLADATSDLLSPVRAEWSGPSGTRRHGAVAVPNGVTAGSFVSIWVDRNGRLSEEPLDSRDAAGEAATVGALVVIGIGVLAGLSYRCLCAVLDRSRLRRWGAEWAITEPVWTRRVP